MARPKCKSELIAQSQSNYNKLINFIDSFTEEERLKNFPEGRLNRNIRDVLAHLHHWHLMMLEWYRVGMSGEKPDMPARGYTWRTVPDLNRTIQKKYCDVDLKVIRDQLDDSYHEIQALIASHSDEELFEKKRYAWTGSTSLGSYFISSSSSHYEWARKLIKKAMA